MASTSTEKTSDVTSEPARVQRRDRLIDGLGLLVAAGFLAWLALAWVQDTFAGWTDALLFLLFFLALAGVCLYRCFGSLRALYRRGGR